MGYIHFRANGTMEPIVIDGRGEGTLSYYGRIRKTGKKMCGISLDDRVVSERAMHVIRTIRSDMDDRVHGLTVCTNMLCR